MLRFKCGCELWGNGVVSIAGKKENYTAVGGGLRLGGKTKQPGNGIIKEVGLEGKGSSHASLARQLMLWTKTRGVTGDNFAHLRDLSERPRYNAPH